jgi:hypothetical protein
MSLVINEKIRSFERRLEELEKKVRELQLDRRKRDC